MLRTGKQVWEATAKRSALEIRQNELNFHIDRYTVLVTQCALLTGFSFESIVHLDARMGDDVPEAIVNWFYASLALAIMCSVYVVVVGSCLIVLGNQLALLGQEGDSLEQAVNELRSRRWFLFFIGFMSLASIISGAMALAWIKMGAIAGTVCFAFAVMAGLTVWSVASVFCSIGSRKLITGATKFFTPTGYFDLAMLQPGVGNPDVLAEKPSDFV